MGRSSFFVIFLYLFNWEKWNFFNICYNKLFLYVIILKYLMDNINKIK